MPAPSHSNLGFTDRLILGVTRLAVKRSLLVLILALVAGCLAWGYASQLRIEGSFVSLLPTDSPTGKRFNNAMGRRSGGNSTLIVMVSSESEEKNRTFVDALTDQLKELPQSQVHAVEKGPGEAREFFKKWRWLFSSRKDLALLECKIKREEAKRKPGYLGLDDPCEESVSVLFDKDESDLLDQASKKEKTAEKSTEKQGGSSKKLSELEKMDSQFELKLRRLDRYPTGYFQKKDGSLFSVMIRAPTAGMGEFSSDQLFSRVKEIVATLEPQGRGIEIGYAGDIPNAIEQRNALISDMAVISLIAVGLILGSIVVFFRSFVALLQIGFCVVVGCGMSFSLAMIAYGRLNTATSFLGAIIAGNGINYGIIYLSRYRELRKEGLARAEALEEAALSSRKGTWLAAVAAGGAYSALLFTSFRGFSEFGLIGGVGMVFCWLATFVILPAQITFFEERFSRIDSGLQSTLSLPLGSVGRFVSQRSLWILVAAGLVTTAASLPLMDYLKDPWEYNFSKLGSSKSKKKKGVGNWSRKANKVFRSRGSPMLILADKMDDVLALKRSLSTQDERVTGGKYLERVETIYDRLGGPPHIVEQKLVSLTAIRKDIDRVLPKLSKKDQEIAQRWRPPDYLRVLSPEDLPELVKAQFTEKDGTVGTPLYVYLSRGLSRSNGHNLLRIAEIFESVKLPNGNVAPNASRSTVFAAMIRAMERDGPLATMIAFLFVVGVTILATRRFITGVAIVGSLLSAVLLTVGGAAWLDVRLNFLNFVALPLTFGIGVEYAINLFERIKSTGSVQEGLSSIGGPVALCSLTTVLGYGALILADNMALQSFGRYAMAGEIACIVTALLVMPAAVHRWGGALTKTG